MSYRSMFSYRRDSSSLRSAHSSRRSRRVALTGFLPLPLSSANTLPFSAPAAVAYLPPPGHARIPSVNRSASLIHGAGPSRLARVCGRSVFPPSRYASTSAARSSCHSSLREIPPCTHGSDAGSSRLARVCRRSTSAATQHVRPALCAERPRFAPHMSSCTHGSDAVCSHASRRAAAGSTISPSRYASASAARSS